MQEMENTEQENGEILSWSNSVLYRGVIALERLGCSVRKYKTGFISLDFFVEHEDV